MNTLQIDTHNHNHTIPPPPPHTHTHTLPTPRTHLLCQVGGVHYIELFFWAAAGLHWTEPAADWVARPHHLRSNLQQGQQGTRVRGCWLSPLCVIVRAHKKNASRQAQQLMWLSDYDGENRIEGNGGREKL